MGISEEGTRENAQREQANPHPRKSGTVDESQTDPINGYRSTRSPNVPA
jgi:hypothetical protein